MVLDDGEMACKPGEVFVDCTAAGVPATATRPVFEPDRITVQFVTIGFIPWSAATIGFVEAMRGDDAEKNRLCPTLAFSGDIADVFSLARSRHDGDVCPRRRARHRGVDRQLPAEPHASAARLTSTTPAVLAAYTSIAENFGPALQNLARQARRRRLP